MYEKQSYILLHLIADWSMYDHYGYAVLAVAGTCLAAALVQRGLHHPRTAPWLGTLSGVAPPFINVISVLFGLTLAFLANDTWSARDRAVNAVFKEADALRSLAALSGTLAPPLRQQVQAATVAYAHASAGEWPLLAQRRSSSSVAQHADALLTLLASPTTAASAGAVVQKLMLDQVMATRDQRDVRAGLSQTHVNPLKWLAMGFLGLVTLLSIAVVHVTQPRAALVAVLLFSLAAAPTAAIVLVQGNPFQPPTAVSPAPLLAAVAGLHS